MSEKGPFSEVDARIGEVCFAPINGLRQSGLSGPKSANKRHALRLAGPVQPGCYPTSTTLGGVTMPFPGRSPP